MLQLRVRVSLHRLHGVPAVLQDVSVTPAAANREMRALCFGVARIPPLVEIVVGVAHRFRLAASEHDLEVDRREAVVLVAVDDAGGA